MMMFNITTFPPPDGVYVTLNGYVVTVTELSVTCVMLLVGVLCFCLNALVLDTLVKRTALEAADLLMCHLAATDMLTGVLVIYNVFYHLFHFLHPVECLVRLGGLFIFISSSVYHLTLLTIDRFVKVVFPYRYPSLITSRSVSLLSVIVWIFSVNLGLMPTYGWRKHDAEGDCVLVLTMTKGYLVFTLVVVYVPVGSIFLMYSKIFLIARRHARAIAVGGIKVSNSGISFKFAKTVMLLIGSFIATVLPIGMFGTLYVANAFPGMTVKEVDTYTVYTSLFIYCNALINPIIYAFKLPPVRKRLLAAMGRTNQENDTETVVTRIEVPTITVQNDLPKVSD